MNRLARNRLGLDAALRSLDPSGHHVGPDAVRARTDLDAILATDPKPESRRRPWSPSAGARRPRRPARTARRLVVAGGLMAAVTAGLVVLPSFTGGDQAFATWTATPDGMSARQSAAAAAGCRENQEDGAGADYAGDLGVADLVIAERRGVWTTVVLAGPEGFRAMCVTDDSAGMFAQGMIGSIGRRTPYAAPAPRELLATDLGTGTMGAGEISLASGAAGSDVTGVVHHSRTHGDVRATVNRGHFALWFPGDELADASRTGLALDVTYRDGTTESVRLTL